MFAEAFRDKTVWLSGATGFKGAWLAEWLTQLGARVHGFALPPDTEPSLFEQLGLANRIKVQFADIRDLDAVRYSCAAAQPDFIFHLAAQPLVRRSYKQPIETFAANVMGTAHVIEALRALEKPCAAIFVTTDKCYLNREWHYGYREDDPLGGNDPYSASKAAAELVVNAWRHSFFATSDIKVASVRAGNVIGGGDWALDRIVPDSVRALQKGVPICVRNPAATRPWQHVLEPLSGYLWLAALLAKPALGRFSAKEFCSAFNLGPNTDANRTVSELVVEVLKHWPGQWVDASDPHAVHEATLLRLSTDKAHSLLGWRPVWSFTETVARTVQWYRCVSELSDTDTAARLTREQFAAYGKRAKELSVPWAGA